MTTTAAVPGLSLKNILYATDFSRYSNAALPFVLSIARKYGSAIFSAHVVPLPPFSRSLPVPVNQELAAQGVREARRALDRAEHKWESVRHQNVIRTGDIWQELAKLIEEKSIDLVVCGTHGRAGLSKVFMGSVAEEIYRHANCPVLTVGPDVVGEPDSVVDIHAILYATDFNSELLNTASYAISLARENQARLYLFHAIEKELSQGMTDDIVERLRDLVPRDSGLLCAPKALVDFGHPSEKIIEVADELKPDLIVLGPRRSPSLPGIGHLPQDTASYVVSKATCPVLTVR